MNRRDDRPPPPEGFKRFPLIVTPGGNLFNPASCSLIVVDVFEQREFESLMADGTTTLNKALQRFYAADLGPIIRKGMK